MPKISLYDAGTNKYWIFDSDTGIFSPTIADTSLPVREGWQSSSFGISVDGRYLFFRTEKYNLREACERKLRTEIYCRDLQTGEVTQMFTKWEECKNFAFGNILIVGDRFFVVACYERDQNIMYSVDFDGADVVELWRSCAYPYGFSWSPDRSSITFHLANYDANDNPHGLYAIYHMDLQGKRTHIYSEAGHLFFNEGWTPDGSLLVFHDCTPATDPGHHRSDLAVCRPGGTGLRRLTQGQSMLFATAFGLPEYRMGGSNYITWSKDGRMLYSKMLPGSNMDYHYDGTQGDHEEMIYDPSEGRGGCGFCLMDVHTGVETVLTPALEGQWDFRPRFSEDGSLLLYTHSEFDKPSQIRMLDLQSGQIRILTDGIDHKGVDHPCFCK